ncbi:MAG: TSUP family transporter [Chitinophagaceae bacterium]
MTNTVVITLLLIGLASGYLSGLMGLGGGIVIIPALVYFLGYSQLAAQGTTLGLLVLPIGLLAAFQYYKAGQIDLKAIGILTIGFVAASYFGSKTAEKMDQTLLRKLFSLGLVGIALKMFFQK